MTSAAIPAGRASGVRRSPGSGDSSVPRRGRRPRRHLTGARLRWVLAGRLPAGGDGRAFLREGDGPFRRGLGSEAVRERAIEALPVITLRRRGRRRQAPARGEPGTEPCAPTHRSPPGRARIDAQKRRVRCASRRLPEVQSGSCGRAWVDQGRLGRPELEGRLHLASHENEGSCALLRVR